MDISVRIFLAVNCDLLLIDWLALLGTINTEGTNTRTVSPMVGQPTCYWCDIGFDATSFPKKFRKNQAARGQWPNRLGRSCRRI